jgi:hypothetical protein
MTTTIVIVMTLLLLANGFAPSQAWTTPPSPPPPPHTEASTTGTRAMVSTTTSSRESSVQQLLFSKTRRIPNHDNFDHNENASSNACSSRRRVFMNGLQQAAALLMVAGSSSLPAFAEDDDTTTITTTTLFEERMSIQEKNLSFKIQIPSTLKQSQKPVKTHLDEVNFASETIKGYQFGITVDPVCINSLKEVRRKKLGRERSVGTKQRGWNLRCHHKSTLLLVSCVPLRNINLALTYYFIFHRSFYLFQFCMHNKVWKPRRGGGSRRDGRGQSRWLIRTHINQRSLPSRRWGLHVGIPVRRQTGKQTCCQ